jgi:hypothetical protein
MPAFAAVTENSITATLVLFERTNSKDEWDESTILEAAKGGNTAGQW